MFWETPVLLIGLEYFYDYLHLTFSPSKIEPIIEENEEVLQKTG